MILELGACTTNNQSISQDHTPLLCHAHKTALIMSGLDPTPHLSVLRNAPDSSTRSNPVPEPGERTGRANDGKATETKHEKCVRKTTGNETVQVESNLKNDTGDGDQVPQKKRMQRSQKVVPKGTVCNSGISSLGAQCVIAQRPNWEDNLCLPSLSPPQRREKDGPS